MTKEKLPEKVGLMAEVLAGMEMAGLPDKPQFAPGSERLSRMGEMSLFKAGWGSWVGTERIGQALQRAGILDEQLKKQIDRLGFSGGYRYAPEVEVYSDRVQAYMQQAAVQMADWAIWGHGWNGAEVMFLGTSTMTEEAVDGLREQLSRADRPVETVKHYSMACMSWTAALTDALRDPDLQGKRVVIVGMDTLTGSMTNLTDPITAITFGNGGGALALVPGEDMQYLRGETVVELDEVGITKCRPGRGLPAPEERVEVLPGYRLVGERTPEYFVVTEEGVFMDIPQSETPYIEMNGRGTFAYFVVKSGVAQMVQRERVMYQALGFEDHFGPLGIPFGHQPSLEVIAGLNKKLAKLAMQQGASEASVEFDWVMRETKFNNISAGTGLVAWEELVFRQQLQPGRAHILLGLGVGASVGAHLVYFPNG